jgi:hypothetical protein
VTGSGPRFKLVGWLHAIDGKLEKWWGDRPPNKPNAKPTGRPCFWVPQAFAPRGALILNGL